MSDADRYWGLSNPGPGNLLLWLEPWADELEVAARSTVILKAPSGPEEVALGEVEWAPDHLVVWASAQTVEAFIDGVLQDTISAVIPVPNGLTKDLLNGETEAQIAKAFAEARRREGVLLFDEADSLLFDRTRAHNSWEVGQVNELLTWLDRHPFPVVAATNHPDSLDPATLRRFVFKLDLRPLGRERAARAFERFFQRAGPASLANLSNLTPGDFAVVARQLRHSPAIDVDDIVDRLRHESSMKPVRGGRVGF